MKKLWENKLKSAFLILLYVLFVILIWYYISSFLVDKEAVRNIVEGYGIFAPLVFILIQIGQNVFAPIAHYPILLAGGFIFGPVLGFLYNWIGTVLGTILVVLLARKFGRPLVNKMVSKRFIEKYDHIIQKLRPYGLFLIYALPVFPDDEITYLIGVSSMPLRNVIFAILIGKIPGAALSVIGDEALNGMKHVLVIQITVLVLGTLFYFRKGIVGLFKKPSI